MKERMVGIATPAGTMETFVVHPERGGPFPAIIVYMDFWGVREELYQIAHRVATVGYCCVVPDLYYRQGTVRNEIRDPNDRMVSLSRLDEAARGRVLAPLRRLVDAEAMEDTGAVFQYLAATKLIRTGAMGCFGYCLGGRLALRAAAAFPDQIKATASLHGSHLVTESKNSPHLMATRLQGELYCGFAEHDPYTPPTTATVLATVMQSSAAIFSCHIHAGTEHGYALPNRDIYNEVAATRDWEHMLAMFERQCPPAQA